MVCTALMNEQLKNCLQLLEDFSSQQCTALGMHSLLLLRNHISTCTFDLSSMFIPILGSETDVARKYRLRLKDGTAEEVDSNDKRVFIQMNGLPSSYKCSQSFLKAAL